MSEKLNYNSDELKKMEAWRGLLCFFVFMAHLCQIYWYPIFGTGTLFSIFVGTIANISVVLFFLLSGILITYSGLNLTKNGTFNWRKYLINRIARIYPSLIVIMILSYFLISIFPYLNHYTTEIIRLPTDKYFAREKYYCTINDMIQALKMQPNDAIQVNGPIWSLVIEWWLYVTGLFLFLISSNNFKLTIKNFFFLIMGLLPLFFLSKDYNFSYSYYCIIWFIGSFFTFYLKKSARTLNIMIASSIVLFILSCYYFKINSFKLLQDTSFVYGIFQIAISLFFLKIIFIINLNKIFNKISSYSYTLYILHFPVILFFYAILKSILNNNILWVSIVNLFLIIVTLILSKIISSFTEKKYFYQNLLLKISESTNNYILNKFDSTRKAKYK
jgi:peptidoglycan/LPS O-acetylase OafA/YrhL